MWAEWGKGRVWDTQGKISGNPTLFPLLKRLSARPVQGPQSYLPGWQGGDKEGQRVSVVPQGQGSLRY